MSNVVIIMLVIAILEIVGFGKELQSFISTHKLPMFALWFMAVAYDFVKR